MKQYKTPPKLAERFLLWFLKPDLAEEVLGDLDEKFYADLKRKSLNKAKIKYWWEVLNYLRPFAIRLALFQNPTFILMLRHTFIISFRSFNKYKTSFVINIVGLSTGIACALLIYLWVLDEVSVDKFHENNFKLHQVLQTFPQSMETNDGTVGILARTLKEEIPEIEYAANVVNPEWFDNEQGIVSFENNHFNAKGQFAEADYLKMFSWKIVKGNKENVLSDKYAVVISERMAEKLFPNEDDIIGKTLEWKQEDSDGLYKVTGIFKDVPYNSTAQFDLLFNYEAIFEENEENFAHWGNSGSQTFITLKEGANIEILNEKIKYFQRDKFRKYHGEKYAEHIATLSTRPYADRYLFNTYENGVQSGGRITYVKLFSLIAIFILVIACINFINLSTARASRRIKEIGVKKAMGVARKYLIAQFLGESILLFLFASCLSVGLVYAMMPEFNRITGKYLDLSFSFSLIALVIGISVFTGILAGSYPALYLSRFKPALILKSGKASKLNHSVSEIIGRKGLVILQFTASIILIVSVLVISNQIELIQTKNLGFNKENIVSIKNIGKLEDNSDVFVNEMKKIPNVINATGFSHDLVGDVGGTGAVVWEGKEERIDFGNLEVGYDWFELLQVEMVEGRTFSREFGNDNQAIIFNEEAIKLMGLKDPVGKTVKLWGKEREIIGVAKNFHFKSLYEEVRPCFIQCDVDNSMTLIKIKAGTELETIKAIENFYKKYNEGLPFEYHFLDQEFQDLYVAEQRVANLSTYFAGIAIIISCLGLFGLAVYNNERRTKEIGIRKVLGASTTQIMYILSGNFMLMVIIAIVIAMPISYLFTKQWLNEFAYRIDLAWWFFAGAGMIALGIAALSIIFQTIKSSQINPVKCLKDE